MTVATCRSGKSDPPRLMLVSQNVRHSWPGTRTGIASGSATVSTLPSTRRSTAGATPSCTCVAAVVPKFLTTRSSTQAPAALSSINTTTYGCACSSRRRRASRSCRYAITPPMTVRSTRDQAARADQTSGRISHKAVAIIPTSSHRPKPRVAPTMADRRAGNRSACGSQSVLTVPIAVARTTTRLARCQVLSTTTEGSDGAVAAPDQPGVWGSLSGGSCGFHGVPMRQPRPTRASTRGTPIPPAYRGRCKIQ